MLRGGLVEQPRKLSGWFRIEKLERYYKLNLHGSVAQSVEQRPFKPRAFTRENPKNRAPSHRTLWALLSTFWGHFGRSTRDGESGEMRVLNDKLNDKVAGFYPCDRDASTKAEPTEVW
jgi:hypothetical protein